MPGCKDCQFFRTVDGKPTCKFQPSDAEIAGRLKLHPNHRPYSRNCVSAIMTLRLPLMTGKVLEIGAGTIKTTRNILREAGKAEWWGIDPRWTGADHSKNAYCATVGKIPFPDNTFEQVMSFESIEHWEEYKEPIPMGLAEILRVLKPGGYFLASLPIHGHGNKSLVAGDMKTIHSWFKVFDRYEFTEWRKEFDPCPPAKNWLIWNRGKDAELVRKNSTQPEPSMWCLEVQAWKAGA